jgi:hypothetical protein
MAPHLFGMLVYVIGKSLSDQKPYHVRRHDKRPVVNESGVKRSNECVVVHRNDASCIF